MQTRKKLPLQLVTFNAETEQAKVVQFGRRASDRLPGGSANSRFETVFEFVSSAVVTVGRDGRIELVNGAAEELTGYLRAELVGKTLDFLAPQPGKAPVRTRALDRAVIEN